MKRTAQDQRSVSANEILEGLMRASDDRIRNDIHIEPFQKIQALFLSGHARRLAQERNYWLHGACVLGDNF